MRWALLPTPTANKARASAIFVPDAPVTTQLYRRGARLAADAQQQEGIGPLESESSLAR